MEKPFHPMKAATVNIDVSSSSQAVQITGIGSGYKQIRIANDGSATVWLNHGGSTVTAALASGFPVPAGAVEVLTFSPDDGVLYIAAIAAGATGKIYFTPGSGV